MNNRIAIIGTGYVGLVTGACLSDFGLSVICIDKNQKKITALKEGIIPIYEPGLELLVRKNQAAGRLFFTTDLKDGVQGSEIIFIAVGTPADKDGSTDLQYIEAVAKDISRYMNGYKVIVNKSTVPIGTARLLKEIILNNQAEPFAFDIVSNPEFLREGSAVHDFMHPDRVIVGTESDRSVDIMKNIYRVLFLNKKTPFLFTDVETAEAIKYASNAFLAIKVTFINEIATLCEKTGANVIDVARGMGMDARIGSKFLNPGPGYGGSCFPKDTRSLARIGEYHDARITLVEATIAANEKQKLRMATKIANALGDLNGKTIGVLGLSFKPETDDMRDAPSITIITELFSKGAQIKTYDPKAMDEARWRLPEAMNIVYCNDEYQVAQDVDALVILTEWNQFRSLDLERIKGLMRAPMFFDLRNIYEPAAMRELGFNYYSVGRG